MGIDRDDVARHRRFNLNDDMEFSHIPPAARAPCHVQRPRSHSINLGRATTLDVHSVRQRDVPLRGAYTIRRRRAKSERKPFRTPQQLPAALFNTSLPSTRRLKTLSRRPPTSGGRQSIHSHFELSKNSNGIIIIAAPN